MLGHDLADAVVIETPQMQLQAASTAEERERDPDGILGIEFRVSVGRHHQERPPCELSCELGQEEQASLVAPLEVVDHEQHRAMFGCFAHGVDNSRKELIAGAGIDLPAERGRRATMVPVLAVEEHGRDGGRRRHPVRRLAQALKQLTPGPVGRQPLGVFAASPCDRRYLFSRALGEGSGETGLADSGVPGEEHQTALSGSGGVPYFEQLAPLGLPADQRPGRAKGGTRALRCGGGRSSGLDGGGSRLCRFGGGGRSCGNGGRLQHDLGACRVHGVWCDQLVPGSAHGLQVAGGLGGFRQLAAYIAHVHRHHAGVAEALVAPDVLHQGLGEATQPGWAAR